MFNYLKIKSKKDKGFTLIEILVVVAIIGIISGVTISSVSKMRMKSRDSTRLTDLANIKLALARYYDAHGYYPQSNCGWDCNGYRYGFESSSWNALATDLAPYLKTLPTDPINSPCPPWENNCYSYAYGNVGRTVYRPQYDLTAQLEDPDHSQRCAVKLWRFYFNDYYPWCPYYSSQIYEASGV